MEEYDKEQYWSLLVPITEMFLCGVVIVISYAYVILQQKTYRINYYLDQLPIIKPMNCNRE
jgi:hypothetical protein